MTVFIFPSQGFLIRSALHGEKPLTWEDGRCYNLTDQKMAKLNIYKKMGKFENNLNSQKVNTCYSNKYRTYSETKTEWDL